MLCYYESLVPNSIGGANHQTTLDNPLGVRHQTQIRQNLSDHWFKSKKKKAEVKPLLDAAMKSTKKIEDYLAT